MIGNVEQQARSAVSAEQLQEHLNAFSTLFRDTGSEDEWKAARYVVDRLKSYGLEAQILEFDSLISWPLEGRLVVLGLNGEELQEFPTRTRAFGAQTPPGGIEIELSFVPFQQPEKGAMIFSHRAVAGDYTGRDVRGRAVLTADGGPDGVLRAQERDAAAHIHIWPSDEDVTHEMICTSIWGTPTPESARRIPTIPALGVKQSVGQQLGELLQRGPVRVRVESNVATEWRHVPLATGYIPGQCEDFLLVGAHIDSWYEGITDNATGDAALLEMARVLAPLRDRLRCGIRFCWWPGHSTGRYSGSTWYADHAFLALRRHGLGYLNIDSPGVRETEIFDCRYNMAEIEHLTAAVVREQSGQEPNIRRPLRAGDQSFLGIGLPSLGAFRMLPVEHPDRKAVGGSGGGWWWHSPEDTLDKADANILAKDVEVYVAIALRMVVPAVIPYKPSASANDFLQYLWSYQEASGGRLDLGEALAEAERFQGAAERLEGMPVQDAGVRNDGLKELTRLLNPVLFTLNGPYEMDPALQLPVLPGLAPAAQLAQLDPASDAYRFLETALVRQRNWVSDTLWQATQLVKRLAEQS